MNSIDYSRRWLFETIDSIDTRGMPYDLSSVMHYGRKVGILVCHEVGLLLNVFI